MANFPGQPQIFIKRKTPKTFHFNSTGQDNQQFHTYFRSIIKKVAKKSTHPGTRDTAAPLEGPAKELNTSQVQAIKCYKKNNNLI